MILLRLFLSFWGPITLPLASTLSGIAAIQFCHIMKMASYITGPSLRCFAGTASWGLEVLWAIWQNYQSPAFGCCPLSPPTSLFFFFFFPHLERSHLKWVHPPFPPETIWTTITGGTVMLTSERWHLAEAACLALTRYVMFCFPYNNLSRRGINNCACGPLFFFVCFFFSCPRFCKQWKKKKKMLFEMCPLDVAILFQLCKQR